MNTLNKWGSTKTIILLCVFSISLYQSWSANMSAQLMNFLSGSETLEILTNMSLFLVIGSVFFIIANSIVQVLLKIQKSNPLISKKWDSYEFNKSPLRHKGLLGFATDFCLICISAGLGLMLGELIHGRITNITLLSIASLGLLSGLYAFYKKNPDLFQK